MIGLQAPHDEQKQHEAVLDRLIHLDRLDRLIHLVRMDRMDRLIHLVRRGQESGDFDSRLHPAWLPAATVALGHAAGNQVTTGRMTNEEASESLKRSALRLYGI
nr:hypothetical protein OG999_34610 [Streptomyces sp. NBC_00886]